MFVMQEASKIYSFLPTWLPRTRRYSRWPVFRTVHRLLNHIWHSIRLPVRANVHGFNVLLNPGNPYCLVVREHPLFNAPLVQLVHQMARKGPLVFIDVGAAIGDTVLLLNERCPRAISHYYCVEGDEEFYAILEENMRQFKNVTLFKRLLAREVMHVRSLVKHHPGTAAPTGNKRVEAVPLDSINEVSATRIDILKVDVDGFDGEVLAGAIATIDRSRPAIIFEWHPKLILSTGCDPFRGFETLAACGYTSFLWFDNLGSFSHFSKADDRENVDNMMKVLLAINNRRDQHFDIVALHPENEIDQIELASLNYAMSWRSKSKTRHS
jgi:FkbM family methyltransferase